jgi:hypothetical protein
MFGLKLCHLATLLPRFAVRRSDLLKLARCQFKYLSTVKAKGGSLLMLKVVSINANAESNPGIIFISESLWRLLVAVVRLRWKQGDRMSLCEKWPKM